MIKEIHGIQKTNLSMNSYNIGIKSVERSGSLDINLTKNEILDQIEL